MLKFEDFKTNRLPMKKLLLILFCLPLIGFGQTERHKEYDAYGKLYEGNLKNKKQDGVWKLYYENGQVKQEENWKDGYYEGLWKYFNENGQIMREVNYKDGEDDGLHRSWYENGQLEMEENYKDGALDGLWKLYYKNGQLQLEQNWKDGIFINSKCWDKEGNEIKCE